MSAPAVTADFGAGTVTRDEVLGWEDGRISAVVSKLGVRAPGGNVAARREALLQAKLDRGPDGIAARLHRETRPAGFGARAGGRIGDGGRVGAVDLTVGGGTAGQFVEAFERWAETSDQPAMLRA